jgi:hypothetical protein
VRVVAWRRGDEQHLNVRAQDRRRRATTRGAEMESSTSSLTRPRGMPGDLGPWKRHGRRPMLALSSVRCKR